MRVRMLQTQRGSPDGISVLTYEAGREYPLDCTERERDLARVFVREGWAVAVSGPAPKVEVSQAAPVEAWRPRATEWSPPVVRAPQVDVPSVKVPSVGSRRRRT